MRQSSKYAIGVKVRLRHKHLAQELPKGTIGIIHGRSSVGDTYRLCKFPKGDKFVYVHMYFQHIEIV
jgi:hypothetical protein